MDLEHEITQVAILVKGLGKYVIVAKSIGTVVATLAIARGLIAPERCVFMGFPLKVIEADIPEVASALAQLPSTAFLHNRGDPLGPAEEVEAYVYARLPTTVGFPFMILTNNTTHDYVDFEFIKLLAEQHLDERLENEYYQPD